MRQHSTIASTMTDTPPFDPPYKCKITDASGVRWVEVRPDGSQVEVAAPAALPPSPPPAKTGGAKPGGGAKGTFLKVPYAEKEEAKRLGARWDPGQKKWYIPSGVDPAGFERWL
jgi:hypothetical protein